MTISIENSRNIFRNNMEPTPADAEMPKEVHQNLVWASTLNHKFSVEIKPGS